MGTEANAAIESANSNCPEGGGGQPPPFFFEAMDREASPFVETPFLMNCTDRSGD